MTEIPNSRLELTLPFGGYQVVATAIEKTYGKKLSEIAEVGPGFAFQALRTGMTAMVIANSQRGLIEQNIYADGSIRTVGVTSPRMDGPQAAEGIAAYYANRTVDTMQDRFTATGQDYEIRTEHTPGLLGRLRRKPPVVEVVAVIRHPK